MLCIRHLEKHTGGEQMTNEWTLDWKLRVESPLPCQYWKDLNFFGNKRTYLRNGNYKYSSRSASPNFYIASKRYNLLKQRRQSRNMETTYINRANTNEEVYRRANAEARTARENHIRPLSQVLQEKRIKLLGHIIRRPREHPQHQTTFYTRSLIPRTVDKRRVGRPRLSWTHETMKVAWNLSKG